MIETNWIVFAGAPCAGKTTLIKKLEEANYSVSHEVVRSYVDDQLTKGFSLEAILSDIPKFQQEVFERRLKREESLNPLNTVFLDRSLVDSLAYYRLRGFNETVVKEKIHQYRYKKVFFFERLPMENTDIRREDEKRAMHLESLFKEVYAEVGYDLIHVPIMPINDRLDFLFERL